MLRDDGDLLFSQVAIRSDIIVGHIALSPMQVLSDDVSIRALGLGPVAVTPDLQSRGIGSKLIYGAIDWARNNDWQMIMLLGNPTYYSRFGFSVEAAKNYTSPYAGPNWQALKLDESLNTPQSAMAHYASAFERL